VELRQLRYFATLAETLHFGRAAAAQHIAPSAFSAQIARLEREVGCRLVERTSRQVRLTAAGLAFAEHAHLTLDSAEQAVRAARDASQALSGQLTLGLLDGGAAAELTVPIVQAFKTTYPAVAVRLRALTYDTHLLALLDGDVDAVLGPSFTDGDDRYLTTPLFIDPRMALLPATHALADSPTVTVTDLLEEVFVHGEGLPVAMDRHFALADAREGSLPRGPVARSMSEVLHLVAGSEAVTTVTAATARYSPFPGVAYRPLVGAPSTTTSLLTRAHRRGQRRSPLLEGLTLTAIHVTSDLMHLVAGAEPPTTSQPASR